MRTIFGPHTQMQATEHRQSQTTHLLKSLCNRQIGKSEKGPPEKKEKENRLKKNTIDDYTDHQTTNKCYIIPLHHMTLSGEYKSKILKLIKNIDGLS